MTSLIQDTADLIAEFDAAAARAFVAQPFNRLALAVAFEGGFRTHSAHSLHVCDLVKRVAVNDIAMRRLAA